MGYDNKNGLTFHEIPDSVVILASKGVYKQSKLYLRGDSIYAKHGAGFIQLSKHGTSVPNVRVDGFHIEGYEVEFNKVGRVAVTPKMAEVLSITHDGGQS